jgi:rhodanese-related sulfurtransferase
MTQITRISAHDIHALATEQPLIIDVRSHAEIDSLSYAGCLRLPLHEINQSSTTQLSADKTVYLLCGTGKRAQMAAEKLSQCLPNTLAIIEGGITAMAAANLPLEQGTSQIMSLERQVRIAAGGLVLTGVVLGSVVHIGFYGLSGFVGAGLMFAGITDTCAMGMMLAVMPWNQRSKNA